MKTIKPKRRKTGSRVFATMYVLVNKFGLVRFVGDSMLACESARDEYGKASDAIYLCESQRITLGQQMA